MSNYRAILKCIGLTEAEGRDAPANIAEGFKNRPWHTNVSSTWDGEFLWLEARNDYDSDGKALLDEFWDEVHANIRWEGPVRFEIVSVSEIETNST